MLNDDGLSSTRALIRRRSELLEQCALVFAPPCRHLVLQARAGQGKTMLARQFCARSGRPLVWHDCAPLDNDPASLLIRLLPDLLAALPDLDAEALSGCTALPGGVPGNLGLFRERLGAIFGRCADQRALLAFDDLHRIDNPDCLRILRALDEAAPPDFRFVLLSRTPLRLEDAPLVAPERSIVIDNDLLGFTLHEISDYFLHRFGRAPSPEDCLRAQRRTEGWAMGLALSPSAAADGVPPLRGDAEQDLDKLFFSACLEGLAPGVVRELLLGARLEAAPEALLRTLGFEDAAVRLAELAAQGKFVTTSQGVAGRTFRMHDMLREALCRRAARELPETERRGFLRTVAAWCRERKAYAETLQLLAELGDAAGLDALLAECQAEPLFRNELHLLETTLGRLRPEEFAGRGWITLTLGGMKLSTNPPEALPLLRTARELLAARGDRQGELLALCYLMQRELFFYADLRAIDRHAARALPLLRAEERRLAPLPRLFCCEQLSFASYVATAGLKNAQYLEELTRTTLRNAGMDRSRPELALSGAYRLVLGDATRFLTQMEPLFMVLRSADLAPLSRFALYMSAANCRAMIGDRPGYEIVIAAFRKDCAQLLENSFLNGFIRVWDTDFRLSRTPPERLPALLTSLGDLRRPDIPEHLSLQLRQQRALALALADDPEAGLREALYCARGRARIGGTFFRNICHAVLGGMLALAGRTHAAERVFAATLRRCAAHGEDYVRPQIYAHRARMRLRLGDAEGARSDILRMAEGLRRFRNLRCFCMPRSIMVDVLGAAMKLPSVRGLAREIARTQLGLEFAENGSPVPQLRARLRDGTLRLEAKDGAFLVCAELKPRQRALLELLLETPGHSLSTAQAAERLWPAADRDRARGSLDACASRLRKDLTDGLGLTQGKDYLRTAAGRIELRHCRVCDAEAARLALRGRRALENNLLWSAHIFFRRMADELTEFREDDFAQRPELAHIVSEAVHEWAGLLRRARMFAELPDVVELGLRAEPLDDQLHALKYAVCVRLRRHAAAALTARTYRNRLLELGCDPAEADAALDDLLRLAGELHLG